MMHVAMEDPDVIKFGVVLLLYPQEARLDQVSAKLIYVYILHKFVHICYMNKMLIFSSFFLDIRATTYWHSLV